MARDVPENLEYKKHTRRRVEPGRASGIAMAQRYGDERTEQQLGASRFLDPTPDERQAARSTRRKKRTGRRQGR